MNKLRSMLFVPADSERKLEKSLTSPADVLILDLEDAVADARKPVAREMAAAHISAHAGTSASRLYVRINPLDTEFALKDLATVVVPGLAGIMAPKIYSAADLVRLSNMLDALEARAGMAAGSVRIVPVATETAQAMLQMNSFVTTPVQRLEGIARGAEDLSAAVAALGGCRALGWARVDPESGLSLGAKHSHTRRYGEHLRRRISPLSGSTRRAGEIFGAIRRCRLVVWPGHTPGRRLGWHRNSPRRGPDPKPGSLLGNREESGAYSPLFDLAGSLCLCAAASAGVPAIDTVNVNFKDSAALALDCRVSRRRGFKGRLAIHPDQVPVINAAYSPTEAEVAHARRIVEAFAAQPDAGALNIDGKMVDKPHLVQAQRTLASL